MTPYSMGWAWLSMMHASLLWPLGFLALSADALQRPVLQRPEAGIEPAASEKAEPQNPPRAAAQSPARAATRAASHLRLVRSG
jgi:hypothetical protein